MIWDHNRSMMYQRAQAVLEDPAAAKYVWGVAFHWYVGDHFDNVAGREAYPKTNLLFTEGCDGPFDVSQINDWQWGEHYGTVHDPRFQQWQRQAGRIGTCCWTNGAGRTMSELLFCADPRATPKRGSCTT